MSEHQLDEIKSTTGHDASESAQPASAAAGSPTRAASRKEKGAKKSSVRARGRKNKRSKQALFRYTHGDHGHAVTVFEKRDKRNLYIKWWNPGKGEMEPHSLGHADQELARNQAKEMSDQIRLRRQPLLAGGEPEIATVLLLYYREHGQKLSGAQPAEHDRRRRLWTGYCAQQPRAIVYPRDMDNTFFTNFVAARRHGDIQVEGIELPAPAAVPPKNAKRDAVVKDGTIDADLIYLNAALSWAANYLVSGEPLLKSKPKVPRCRPQNGTLRQPVAAEDDLEALRGVCDSVDPQQLLKHWLELENQYGWRVSGLSSIKANEIDFMPAPHAPHGRLIKNPTIDKERRGDGVPLTPHTAAVLGEILALRGLQPGDDAYLFVAPKSRGTRPWSRWHVATLLKRAEEAAKIAHIGGLHAWRRKWHTERKFYPAADVAAAAGYADLSSLDRYRKVDPETTYRVVAEPQVVIRRAPRSDAQGAADTRRAPSPAIDPATPTAREQRGRGATPGMAGPGTEPAVAVGQGRGSSSRSLMPDGSLVESRDERFAANLAVARAYASEHGHLLPKKHERPGGVNLLMWLKNQELRIAKGTLPSDRESELDAMPEWRARLTERGVTPRS